MISYDNKLHNPKVLMLPSIRSPIIHTANQQMPLRDRARGERQYVVDPP